MRRLLDLRSWGFGSAFLLAVMPLDVVSSFESGRTGFSVHVNDLLIPYEVFAIYALPGESLELRVEPPENPGRHELRAAGGELRPGASAGWIWVAPADPGLSTIDIDNGEARMRLNVFVMHPAFLVRDGRLNGYRIGEYPDEPLNGNPLYLAPDGFVELNDDTADVQLSPHFRLSQFPSKQLPADYPKYLVLREQLLLKLELLLEHVNRHGIAADTFAIMSGYRTPYYNAAIRNVPHSRHVYGGAADIFIDADSRSDYMDDLNGDGALDFRDAQFLYRLADDLFGEEAHRALRGGLGVYRRTSAHGPFVHVDARARRARWGLLP
jgi:hypothetical protein